MGGQDIRVLERQAGGLSMILPGIFVAIQEVSGQDLILQYDVAGSSEPTGSC